MGDGGQVMVRGRFRPGSLVTLVRVADEGVLRAEGGALIGQRVVDEDGLLAFGEGVEVDARYFLVGQVDGVPVELRVVGLASGEDGAVLAQAPVAAERTKRADGSFDDEHGTPPVVVEADERGVPVDAAPIADGAVLVAGSAATAPASDQDVSEAPSDAVNGEPATPEPETAPAEADPSAEAQGSASSPSAEDHGAGAVAAPVDDAWAATPPPAAPADPPAPGEAATPAEAPGSDTSPEAAGALEARAAELGIEGRSTMTPDELAVAVAAADTTTPKEQ